MSDAMGSIKHAQYRSLPNILTWLALSTNQNAVLVGFVRQHSPLPLATAWVDSSNSPVHWVQSRKNPVRVLTNGRACYKTIESKIKMAAVQI